MGYGILGILYEIPCVSALLIHPPLTGSSLSFPSGMSRGSSFCPIGKRFRSGHSLLRRHVLRGLDVGDLGDALWRGNPLRARKGASASADCRGNSRSEEIWPDLNLLQAFRRPEKKRPVPEWKVHHPGVDDELGRSPWPQPAHSHITMAGICPDTGQGLLSHLPSRHSCTPVFGPHGMRPITTPASRSSTMCLPTSSRCQRYRRRRWDVFSPSTFPRSRSDGHFRYPEMGRPEAVSKRLARCQSQHGRGQATLRASYIILRLRWTCTHCVKLNARLGSYGESGGDGAIPEVLGTSPSRQWTCLNAPSRHHACVCAPA